MPRYKSFRVISHAEICHNMHVIAMSRHKLCLVSQHILQDNHLHTKINVILSIDININNI